MVKENYFNSNMIMNKLFVCVALFLVAGIAFAQNSLSLEIVGAKKQGGKLYVSLFNSEQSFKEREIYYSIVANTNKETVILPLVLPQGEYLFSIYQDDNCNSKLDTNFLGIPKELFGFSNYDGKSAPGNFKKHRVLVNEKTKKITIHLYKI